MAFTTTDESTMTPPTHSKAEIISMLDKKTALIVHFSTCPKMLSSGRDVSYFPNDINYLLDGNRPPLSCSIVSSSHIFDYSNPDRHAPGSVGVVIAIKNEKSILLAMNTDAGTDDEMKRKLIEVQAVASLEDIENAANREKGYCELAVHNYEISGIFISPGQLIAETSKSNQISITHPALAGLFPGTPKYTFYEGELWRIAPEAEKITPSQISCA